MKEIHLKIFPEYYEALAAGKKKYELRLGDKDIKEGDVLVLEEYSGLGEGRMPTGRVLRKTVSYIRTFTIADLETRWPKEEIEKHGIVIASLSD